MGRDWDSRRHACRSAAPAEDATGARAAGPHGEKLASIAATLNAAAPVQRAANRTGMPDRLKAGVEALSGMSLDHVRVHHNSARPAQLNAHAFAQGADIHLAPGQGRHLPHEAWHVVQQAQGRVKPTMQMKVGQGAVAQRAVGVPINDDQDLEQEADVMGARALSTATPAPVQRRAAGRAEAVLQRVVDSNGKKIDVKTLTNDQIRELLHLGNSGDLTMENGDAELLAGEFQARELVGGKRARVRLTETPEKKKKKVENALEDEGTPKEEPPEESSSDESEVEEDGSESSSDEGVSDESSSDDEFTLSRNDEIVSYMTTYGRYNAGLDFPKFKDGEELEPRQWPELSLQGTIGEYLARDKMGKTGDTIQDLNEFQLNFPGVDHLTNNKKYPFEQTKLHISESTAKPETYLNHVKKSGDYAIKAVRALKKKHNAFREMLKDDKFKDNETLIELNKALGELDGTGDDDIDGSEAQALVQNGMRFTIPRDIYEEMPRESRGPFLPLDESVDDIREIMWMLEDDFIPKKPSGSNKEDKDGDFIP